MAQGGLPIMQPDIETSKLSPANIQHIKAQLEEAWQCLLDHMDCAEAKEAWVTEQKSDPPLSPIEASLPQAFPQPFYAKSEPNRLCHWQQDILHVVKHCQPRQQQSPGHKGG